MFRSASPPRHFCARLVALASLASATLGCSPDTRSVEGALAAAARATESGDARALYKVLDERARHAMISIVRDRRRSAELVQAQYPEPERSRTLAALGEAAHVEDAASLFARRCDAGCMAAIAAQLAAPRSQRQAGAELVVDTARDTEVRLYRGSDTRYGLVWQTEALSRERNQAARDAEQIQKNADLYAKRRRLESPTP
jgi:hypothetical protein